MVNSPGTTSQAERLATVVGNDHAQHQPHPRLAFALLALITLVAAALRFAYLGSKDIWYDEAFSISVAQLPWPDFRKVITNREANSALHYLTLKLWIVAFGTGEYAARSLSALAGIATVPALYLLARRLFGYPVAIVSALLLAFNTYHIRYSQEARGYAMAVLLAVLCTLAFTELLRKPNRAQVVTYSILCVAAIYTHLFCALVVLAHFAAPGMSSWRKLPLRKFAYSGATIILFSVPMLLFVWKKDVGQIDWIAPPTLASLVELAVKFAGNGAIWLTVASVAAVAYGVALTIKRRFTPEVSNTQPRALVITWLFLPLLLALTISFWKPIFLPRYLIVALPAFILFAAIGIVGLASRAPLRRILLFALTGFIVLGSAHSTWTWYQNSFDPPPQRWRKLARDLTAENAAQVIFHHPYMRLPFDYYREQLQLPPARIVFPSIEGPHLLVAPKKVIDLNDRAIHDLTRQLAACCDTVLLVRGSTDSTSRELQRRLDENFSLHSEHSYAIGLDLFRYSRRASSKERAQR